MTMTSSDHTDHRDQLAELADLVNAATVAQAPAADPEPTQTSDKTMNRDKPELPAYMIALIGLIIIGVLTFHGDHVPDILNLAVIGSLGIGGAVTTPKSGGD